MENMMKLTKERLQKISSKEKMIERSANKIIDSAEKKIISAAKCGRKKVIIAELEEEYGEEIIKIAKEEISNKVDEDLLEIKKENNFSSREKCYDTFILKANWEC